MQSFTAEAPARANVIGEHTDYAPNGGHVLPTPLPFHTAVTVTTLKAKPGTVLIASEAFEEAPRSRLLSGAREGHWTDYVTGCLAYAADKVELPALNVAVKSNIPFGCGISSSAALCVATLRAVRGLLGTRWNDEEIALMAYVAEHDYVGVPCGKMDQFASSIGIAGQALLLDTKTLVYNNVGLPSGMALMLVDCGKRHDLAKGDSHQKRVARMEECIFARDALGVGTLCELGYDDLPRLAALPENIARRARHVITENLRVLEFAEALKRGDREKQNELMALSHISQRDDFECSIPEIDRLVESSIRFGAKGARLVGGGFGGAILALVPAGDAVAWWSFVQKENPTAKLISTYALNPAANENAA